MIEIIRFKVSLEKTSDFVAIRKEVDEQLKEIDGFLSTELCHIGHEDWTVFIRWRDSESATAARHITESLPIITEWTSLAKQFVSFDTAKTEYLSVR